MAQSDERNWDTFGLFQHLLNNWNNLLMKAKALESSSSEDTLEIKLAITGYAFFRLIETWDYDCYQFIARNLQGDLAEVVEDWPKQEAEPYVLFACLALGALLGKFCAGDIDEVGLLLGEAHLPGFMFSHLEAIDFLNHDNASQKWTGG